jgi:hypothetical protein
MSDSNNDLLSELADEVRGYHKSNNELLKQILLNDSDNTPIVKQDPIQELNPDNVTDVDIANKVNEIIGALRDSGLIES